MPSLVAERQELEKQMQAADEALEAADQLHDETVGPLEVRLDEIRDAVKGATDARLELVSTCTDAGLLEELAAVSEKLTAARTAEVECRSALERPRSQARMASAASERAKAIWRGEDQVEEHRREAAKYERFAAEREADLPRIEKRIAKLEREADGVRERMLVP